MRKIITILLFCLSGLIQAGNVSASNDKLVQSNALREPDTVRWALAQVESGHLKNPDAARGASGEISRFQIMPEIWKDYTRSRNFRNPTIAWSVAHRILRDRHSWFTSSTGREPSPFDLYVMWNKPGLYGRVGFDPQKLPRRLRDVATRFANLFESFQTKRVVSVQGE